MNKPNDCVISFAFCRPLLMAKSVLSIKLNYSSLEDYHHILVVDRALSNSHRIDENNKTIELARALYDLGFVDKVLIRDEPYGTQQNIVQGVSEAAQDHGRLFVVEDDLELIHYHRDLSKTFFTEHLRGPVTAFSTYANSIKNLQYSTFLSNRFSSQAWGIFGKTWSDFDLEYIRRQPISTALKNELVFHLGTDMPRAVAGFKAGAIDSWAIPWNLHNYLSGHLMAYPAKSYVREAGHKLGATRTVGVKFKCEVADEFLDLSSMQPREDQGVSRAYIAHFSVLRRIIRQVRARVWRIYV